MADLFTLKLKQMHPGVADMDAVYNFVCEYNGKSYENNAGDTMFMLSTDCDEVTVNGLEVIVPYTFRQAKRSVRITATLNDYVHKITGKTDYTLSFSTVFSDEPTFFDDFDFYDHDKWKHGEEGWEYGETPAGYVEDSDMVLHCTKEHKHSIITTAHSFQQTFGCFSAKMKFPKRKSTECNCNMAFWLASNIFEPDKIMFKRNPNVEEKFGRSHAGEIDICEYSGAFGDYTALSYHHYGWGQYHIGSGYCAPTPGIRDGYHTFSLVWEPDALYWYYDGILVRTINDENIKDAGKEPGGDMVVLLQSGYSTPPPNFPGTWTGMTDEKDFPMEFRTDWVKVHAIK